MVVFHDEDLYTLEGRSSEAHRGQRYCFIRAVRQWLENREDAGLLPVIEPARTEWKKAVAGGGVASGRGLCVPAPGERVPAVSSRVHPDGRSNSAV